MGHLVTPQALGKYERAEALPSPRVLAVLARTLGMTEASLLAAPEPSLTEVHFRTKIPVGARVRSWIEASVLRHLDAYCEVEERLGLATDSWDRPRGSPYPADEHGAEVEMAAETLRRHWGLGVRPLSNLVEIIEDHGIKVVFLPLPEGVAGASVEALAPQRRGAPGIVGSSRGPRERQRFTFAHELGHLILRARPGASVEKMADRFAGAFLMPAETVWTEVGRHRTRIGGDELLELKRLFGVSAQALTYRCLALNAFRPRLARDLFWQFRNRGWSSPPYREEGENPEVEHPTRFRRLCLRAMAEDVISPSRAAVLLQMAGSVLEPRPERPVFREAGPDAW